MWRFWNKASVAPLTEPLRVRLAAERGVGAQTASGLRMLQERGSYAGRSVTYFHVFDPATAGPLSANLRRLGDLAPGRILHSGHIERNGQVVLNQSVEQRRP